MLRITKKEIYIVVLGIVIATANWFVGAGARDWFINKYPNVSTVTVGIFIIIGVLLLFRYVGRLPIKL